MNVTINNESLANTTESLVDEPFHYQYWKILLGIFVIATLFGNTLVVLAVIKVKSLQSVTNYLIVSLAVADITVGVLVMPFSVYVEVMNRRFPLHTLVCDFWMAVDVLASSASILMMMSISIDRFLAVSYAVKYAHTLKRSTRYPILMITICWVTALIIALPVLIGVNHSVERSKYSCSFSNPLYIHLSSLGSFFLPTITMIILYWKIFRIIRQRGQQSKMKKTKGQKTTDLKQELQELSSENSEVTQSVENGSKPKAVGDNSSPQQSCISEQESRLETIGDNSSTQQNCISEQESPDKNKSLSHENDCLIKPVNGSATKNGNKEVVDTETEMKKDVKKRGVAEKQNSRLSIRKNRSATNRDRRDNRERKVTITLVVVLCIFLICWIPFFVANNIGGFCTTYKMTSAVCSIPDNVFSMFVWLGYINSMLNPIIYALLNDEYRKAFKRLLCCKGVDRLNRRRSFK